MTRSSGRIPSRTPIAPSTAVPRTAIAPINTSNPTSLLKVPSWSVLEYPTASTVPSCCGTATIRIAVPLVSRSVTGSMPRAWHHSTYASGAISLGLISLRPPQKTLV